VKLHALDPAYAKHREAEAVLQAAEFALYGGAPLVERGHSGVPRLIGVSGWMRPLRSGITGAMPRSWHSA